MKDFDISLLRKSVELSYRDRLRETDVLFGEIVHHSAEVMTKVRSQKSEVRTISVFIPTGKYDKCLPYL